MMLSRVADNLYWMSRYLERAEHTARLVDVCLDLIPDRSTDAVQRAWNKVFASLNLALPEADTYDAFARTNSLTFDTGNPASVVSNIAGARENARQVRELISSEMWEQINRLYLEVRKADLATIWDEQPHAFFQMVKQGSHLFEGITASTMNHGEGWYFIQLGQFMERATNTLHLLRVHVDPNPETSDIDPTDQYLDWIGLLRSCTALEAYCKVYTAEPVFHHIAEFLLLHSDFPHAVHFAVDQVRRALDAITQATGLRSQTPLYRKVGRLTAMLDYDHIDEVVAGDFHAYLQHIQGQCAAIHNALYDTFINYPIDEKLMAS